MRHLVVGTAGHIDHGKSTLVHALTGIDPDRLKEEKARGITIELGFAHTTVGDTGVAFVDVPGHERFVRTMLAGVGGIDCVLLVVAADESVMPQTREHFDICRLLQVREGIVVLTKAEAADAETRELVRMDVDDLVAGSFLEGAPVLDVSARTGEGLDALRTALVTVAGRVARRADEGPARLPIDRVFTMRGFGTVVTGTLVSGAISVEDELELLPGGRRVTVRGVQVHGEKRARVTAGHRAAINLGGVDVHDVTRGQTLASPRSLAVTRRVDAVVDLLTSTRSLKHGSRVRVHQGTSEVLARVSIASAGRADIKPGEQAHVRLRLESEAALTRGDRFIFRAYSPLATIGGGWVIDAQPVRHGVRSEAGLLHLQRLAQKGEGIDVPALATMVREAAAHGLPLGDLMPRAGVWPSVLPAAVKAMVDARAALLAGDRLVDPSIVEELSGALIGMLTAFHQSQPLSEGVSREEVRERLFARADPAVFEFVLARLAGQGRVAGRDRVSLSTHRVALSGDEARARAAVEEVYRRAGLKPPDAASVAQACGLSPADCEKWTQMLVRQKILQRLDVLTFHTAALAELKREVGALKAQAGSGRATVDVAAFKERYGVTRKYAIPLLEYLDRERVTRRMGDVRVVI